MSQVAAVAPQGSYGVQPAPPPAIYGVNQNGAQVTAPQQTTYKVSPSPPPPTVNNYGAPSITQPTASYSTTFNGFNKKRVS